MNFSPDFTPASSFSGGALRRFRFAPDKYTPWRENQRIALTRKTFTSQTEIRKEVQ